ncbi:MAG: flagellar hook-basal body complex protein [Phycisphaerales bacterium]|nr:flagellar hook-basal body complex protein [Phycisphaerales bacterium]
MASTSTLFTGLTGLNAHARKLDVIGNNIANVNTTAFKSSRMLFSSMFTQNLGLGTTPSEVLGGVNPKQIGNGVSIGAIQRNFNNGTLNPTGDLRDMAVDGSGFFVVEREGQAFYTRAGTFRQDPSDNLTTATGERLLGYAIDEDFNILTGQLVPINIPVGKRTIAEATENVSVVGNLNKDGDIPTQGSIIELLGTATAGFSELGGGFITATSLLTDIEDPNAAATALFTVGQSIQISGASVGEAEVPDAILNITATTTVQDFMDFIDAAMGIQAAAGANPDGNTPGVTVDPLTGIIEIVGNTGTINDLAIASGDIQLLDSAGAYVSSPFVADKSVSADGESIRTTFVVYDSLGTDVRVDVSMVLDSTPDEGPVWRYYLSAADDTDLDLAITTGLLQFDTDGQLDPDSSSISVTVDRDDTGAGTPLTFDLSFVSDSGQTTSLDTSSSLIGLATDGLPPGTLETFAAGEDGIILGRFSNGAIRTMGQVVLANFSNPAGLIDAGGNLFATGPNSGPAAIASAGELGNGTIVSGALELSNVDLGEEFTQMILTSTGYSASSRVIRTADELIQQLLVLGR